MFIYSLIIITQLKIEYNVSMIATDDDSTAQDVAWLFVFMQILCSC